MDFEDGKRWSNRGDLNKILKMIALSGNGIHTQ
jgi:hypothetical protein